MIDMPATMDTPSGCAKVLGGNDGWWRLGEILAASVYGIRHCDDGVLSDYLEQIEQVAERLMAGEE